MKILPEMTEAGVQTLLAARATGQPIEWSALVNDIYQAMYSVNISQRTRRGHQQAIARGKKLGRKPRAKSLSSADKSILKALETESIREVARRLDVGRGVIQRISRKRHLLPKEAGLL